MFLKFLVNLVWRKHLSAACICDCLSSAWCGKTGCSGPWGMKAGERAGWRWRMRGRRKAAAVVVCSLCVGLVWFGSNHKPGLRDAERNSLCFSNERKRINRYVTSLIFTSLVCVLKTPAIPRISNKRQKQSTFSVPPSVSSSISCVWQMSLQWDH